MVNELANTGNTFTLEIKEFSRRDQGLLSFIFIYLFPFIMSPSELIILDYIMYGLTFIVIVLIMTDIGSYNFNPMMRVCKYKFYTIKDVNNLNMLLITKRNLRSNDPINTRRITHDVFIEVETND